VNTRCARIPSRYGRVVQLQFGERAFDVASRALVLASLSAAEVAGPGLAATTAVHPGIIEITDVSSDTVDAAIGHVCDTFDGPISVLTDNATLAHAALSAGAHAVHDPSGLSDPDYLLAVDETGGSIILSCPANTAAPMAFLVERSRWARAAGIGPERVVLHAPVSVVDTLVASGYCVMVTSPDDPTAQGFNATMVSRGVRLVASNAVQATRRTIDAVSEFVNRREPERCELTGDI